MNQEKHKKLFPKLRELETIEDDELQEDSSAKSHLDKALKTVADGVDYVLHGEKEDENTEIQSKSFIHSLEIKQHHIIMVMLIFLAIVLFSVFKDKINPIKSLENQIPIVNKVEPVTQPPLSTKGNPLHWEVEIPTAVNVADVPQKLIQQMAALYNGVSPDNFRWFRTPKGWSAYYDAQKAKVKFSTEGYWLETEEKDFPISNVPEYLTARLKMSYTSYTLVKCERETCASGQYYELTLKKNRSDKVNEEFNVYLSEKAYNYANLYEGEGY